LGRSHLPLFSAFKRIKLITRDVGFTLIELLVAVAIIGTLASSLALVINPGAQLAKAHDAQRKNDLEQVGVALDTYYNDNNKYPMGSGTFGEAALGDQLRDYLPKLPQDPLSTQSYRYESSGRSYRLYANLERCSDSQGVAGVDCQRTGQDTGNYSINSANLAAITPIPTLTPTPTPTPIPGLVGRWKFDENSGTTANDSSGYVNTGTLVNAPLWVPGRYNSALSFTGTNYVNAGNGASLNITGDLTIEAWIKQDIWNTNYAGVVHKFSSGYVGYRLTTSNGYLSFDYGAPSYQGGAVSTGRFSQGIWHHVAVVKSGTSVIYYIDGANSGGWTAGNANIAVSSVGVRIGHNQYNNVYFPGLIDDVRIYNRALSQPEINASKDGAQ